MWFVQGDSRRTSVGSQPYDIYWRAATITLPDGVKRTFSRSGARCVVSFDHITALDLLTNGCNIGTLDLGRKDNKVELVAPIRLRFSLLTGNLTLIAYQAVGSSIGGAPMQGSNAHAPERNLSNKRIVIARVLALPS
jgi:hypothetical protein